MDIKPQTTIDTSNMVHTESTHDSHKGMYKTLNLFYLDTVNGKVWFVSEGVTQLEKGDEIDPLDASYFYNEHTCPTNFIRCEAIVHDGNIDEHGVFTYVRSLWMTKNYAEDNEGWIAKNFPELGVSYD